MENDDQTDDNNFNNGSSISGNYSLPRSVLAEKIIRFEGKPFSLSDGYDLYKAIYDIKASTLLLINGRQTGKSLTIANFINLDSVAIPYIKSLYLSPSQTQTTRFSHTKLAKVANGSPLIKRFLGGEGVNNVFLKVLKNLSEQFLSYAQDDPDRIRGITADRIYYDEVQDMDYPNISSVADSCMDASADPRKIVSGTPKSVENSLEDLWQRSTQTEPLIACRVCSVWNKPDIKNIGKKGFICKKCGRTLNVRDFAWKEFNAGSRINGFCIPQIVLPSHTESPVKWDLLLDKFETYPTAKFRNEIMAKSDSQGTRLITRVDLVKCCRPYEIYHSPGSDIAAECTTIVAGVDWSGGGKHGLSRTVLHIWGITPNLKYKTLFYKIYPVEDPVNSVEDIATLCDRFGVRLCLGDNGEGSLANGILTTKLGRHRMARFQYGAQAKPLIIDPDTGIYRIDKTTMIDNFFHFIKKEGVIYPNEIMSEEMFKDILNEFSEITHTGRKIWTHGISNPDDCLHAQMGGWLAGKIINRDLTFY